MIPKNIRKKIKLFAENCGQIIEQTIYPFEVDEREKKILEIFNYNGNFKIKSRRSKNSKAKLYPRNLNDRTSRIGFIKKHRMKKPRKIFKICKKLREMKKTMTFSNFLKENIELNKQILNELSSNEYSCQKLMEIMLINKKNERIVPLDNDLTLNRLIQANMSCIDFFVSIKNFQLQTEEEMRKLYVISENFPQDHSDDTKIKLYTKISNLSTKMDFVHV
jgi:hypothetical protein